VSATWLQQLRAWPVLALFLAAVDTVLVRLELDHRPTSAALYVQAVLLWAAFGLLALPPAWATARWLERRARAPGPARDALVLLAWMALPVLLHARLDRYTNLGADVSQLLGVRPWLDAGLALLLALALLWLASRALRQRSRKLALGVAAASLLVGLFLPPSRTGSRDDPAPGAGERPNLLLLVWDTTRAPSLALYGYDRLTTPHLADLAGTSHVFANARSASRYTFTSHLSLLTGTYPSHHMARLLRQELKRSITPPVVEALREAGYRTGGFVGTGVLRAQTKIRVGFEVWDDEVDPLVCDTHAWALVHDLQSIAARLGPPFSRNGRPHWIQDFTRPASTVLARARAWIENGDPRPWFCLVNLYDVHWPYLPPQEARERWVRPYAGPIDGFVFRSDRFVRGTRLGLADDRHLLDLYDGEMWQLDRDVHAFLERLDLERTAIVITSDHGEAFGEGGRYEHDDILEAQVRVPLLLRPPKGLAGSMGGQVHALPTSGVDVAPTLLALAGLPAQEHHTGISLHPPPAPDPERLVLVEDRDHMNPLDVRLALYRGEWKLVRRGLGKGQRYTLHRLTDDPQGLKDVSGDHPELLDELKLALDELRSRWRPDDEADAASSAGGDQNQDALKALGYAGE
jgi:arylsulfatase A-like enzyme